jgi:hypothetical protein
LLAERVTIHEVVRVTKDAVRFSRWTYLSFKLSDGSLHNWVVPGWPEVYSGMTVTAFLKRPLKTRGSNTVLGWQDLRNGTLVFSPVQVSDLMYLAFAFFVSFGFYRLYVDYPHGSSLSSPLPAMAFGAIGLWGCHTIVRKLRVIAHLRRLERNT